MAEIRDNGGERGAGACWQGKSSVSMYADNGKHVCKSLREDWFLFSGSVPEEEGDAYRASAWAWVWQHSPSNHRLTRTLR